MKKSPRFAFRFRYLPFVALLVGCACGGDLYFCAAGGPSEPATDRPSADAPHADSSVIDAPPDLVPLTDAPTDLVDGAEVVTVDAPDDVFFFDGEDDVHDDHLMVDTPDAATDLPDALDLPEVAPDGMVEVGVDAHEEMALVDLPDAHDVPADQADVLMDMIVPDAGDVIDAAEVATDAPDASPDMPDVLADAPLEVADMGDVAEVGVDVPADIFTGPELVIDYRPRDTDGSSVPPSGRASRIDYLFEGMARPMVQCTSTLRPDDERFWRCTVATIPEVGRTTATFLYLVVPQACGTGEEIPCPSTWAERWIVIWFGRSYSFADRVSFDGGTVPALSMLDRDTCFARTGYANPCIRFTIPPR